MPKIVNSLFVKKLKQDHRAGSGCLPTMSYLQTSGRPNTMFFPRGITTEGLVTCHVEGCVSWS